MNSATFKQSWDICTNIYRSRYNVRHFKEAYKGGQPQKWPPVTSTSWQCLPLKKNLFPLDLRTCLMNRLWGKWGDIISEIRLQKTGLPSWVLASFSLGFLALGESSSHVMRRPREEALVAEELRLPTTTWMGLNVGLLSKSGPQINPTWLPTSLTAT